MPSPLRESRRGRVEQDQHRVERRRGHEDDAGAILADRMCLRVDHAHAGRAVLALIVNDRMHDGVGAQCHVAGLRRPRERRGVRGEVGAERAAAPAQVARAAGAASLLQMDRLGLRQMSPSAAHHVAIAVVSADLVAHVLLDAVEVERRQEFAVGHRLDSVAGAAHADEALDVRVPRSDVLVADRPADPVAMTLRRRELVVAPALAGAAPHDRLAAHLVAADPVERLLLHVGMLGVLHEEVLHVFRPAITLITGLCSTTLRVSRPRCGSCQGARFAVG